MPYALMPYPKIRFFDANGKPLAGGKVYFYEAGTSTPKDTYTDSSGSAKNTNPVILDANGEAEIWLSGFYKVVLKDANDNLLWEVDNVSSSPELTQNTQASEWLSYAHTFSYVSANQFSVSGDQRSIYHLRRRVKCVVSAGTVYGTISANSYANGVTTITVELDDNATLDNGLSDVDVGILSAVNTSLPVAPVGWTKVNRTSNYSAGAGDCVIICDASAGPITVTLPYVTEGKIFAIKKEDSTANAVTIQPSGTERIDGEANKVLSTQFDYIMLIGDGTSWRVISANYTGMVLNSPKIDTINEATAGNGVTIDGLNIKDGVIATSNSVPKAALQSNAIGDGKIDWTDVRGLAQFCLNQVEVSTTSQSLVSVIKVPVYIPNNASNLQAYVELKTDGGVGNAVLSDGTNDSSGTADYSGTTYDWFLTGTLSVSSFSGWTFIYIKARNTTAGNTTWIRRVVCIFT